MGQLLPVSVKLGAHLQKPVVSDQNAIDTFVGMQAVTAVSQVDPGRAGENRAGHGQAQIFHLQHRGEGQAGPGGGPANGNLVRGVISQ